MDQLPESIEEGGVRGGDRDALKRVFEPEGRELTRRVRQEIDADADRPQLSGGFKNPARDAGPMQRDPERQPANAGADDDDLVHVSVPIVFWR